GVLIYKKVFFHKYFFFQAEDGIRDRNVTGVQTCDLPISYILENYERFWSSFQEEGQVNEQQIRKISALFNQNRQLIHQSLNKSGKTHIEEIEEIFKGIKEKGKEEVIPYIIFSHIHMFNNRIGLPSYLETSLASIMKETNRGVNHL